MFAPLRPDAAAFIRPIKTIEVALLVRFLLIVGSVVATKTAFINDRYFFSELIKWLSNCNLTLSLKRAVNYKQHP